MKILVKRILPHTILSFLRSLKNIFKHRKPKWHSVNSGILKNTKIYVNESNDYFAQMKNGTYDNFIYESINDKDIKGSTVLDIGCHIGYHTFCFSRLVGSKGKVYAIDPNHYNLDRLKKIGEENSLMSNINICDIGISSNRGLLNFKFSSNVDDMTSSGGYIDGTLTPLRESVYLNAGYVKKK